MRKLFLIAFAFWAVFQHVDLWGQVFNQPVTFATGSSLTINSGVQTNFNGPVDWTGATITNFPTPTVTIGGNATGSAVPPATLSLTINTVPDLTSFLGRGRFTNTAAGTAPPSGDVDIYADSTDKRFHDKNDAGTTGTTVVANTGSANNFLTAIATNGVISIAQPVFSNLSGNIAITQEPSIAANNLIGNATGSSAVPTAVSPLTARSSSLLDIDQLRNGGDAAYTILSTDRNVYTTALTTTRAYTLPAANSINGGQSLTVGDFNGVASLSNNINITRAGSDTINPGANTTVPIKQASQSISYLSDGVSKWEAWAFYPGTPTGNAMVQADGTEWRTSNLTWPSTNSPLDYSAVSTGSSGVIMYPASLAASSTSTVSAGYSADTYVAGTSPQPVAAGDFKAQGRYHFVFDMTKTGAGTSAAVITVRVGTTGSISDAAVCTLTFSAGTAVADSGVFEGWVDFRTVGSGTSAVFNAISTCVHQGGTTGLVSKNSDYAQNLSAGFATNTATRIGVSFNGGSSFSGTNTSAHGDLIQP